MMLLIVLLLMVVPAWAGPKNQNGDNAEMPVSSRCVTADGLSYESCGGSGTALGSTSYDIKRTNITTSSVNLAFGFTSKKLSLRFPLTNTAEMCVSWAGGTAVCPSANTAGNARFAPGDSIILDNFSATSISVIADSGTQTIYVEAW